jgi:hypothetical protein
LQFAKAGSAVAPSQQEKNYSADVQLGRFSHRGNSTSTSSSRWPTHFSTAVTPRALVVKKNWRGPPAALPGANKNKTII